MVINDGVFIIGGRDGSTWASLTTVAHFKENIWTLKGNLKRPRDTHGAITVNGLIYVTGGDNRWSSHVTRTDSSWCLEVEVWDPATSTSKIITSLPDNAYVTAPHMFLVHPDQCKFCTNKDCGNGICVKVDGKEHCQCDDGFENVNLDPLEPCEQDIIDECDRGIECGRGKCENLVGSYKCSCEFGFSNIQNSPTSPCSQSCDEGYQHKDNDSNEPCEDIDECKDYDCGFGTCSNTVGSFSCLCFEGYDKEEDISPCLNCKKGFRNRSLPCEDIDECINFDCRGPESHGQCMNTPGSFNCICPEEVYNKFGACGKIQ